MTEVPLRCLCARGNELLAGAIDHFALRAQHHDAGLTPFVHANADAWTPLWVRNQQLGLLVLIGERNALHPLTVLDSTRVRSAIEDIEGRAPICAVGTLLFPDSDAICQLIGVVERKVCHVVVVQFCLREAAGLLALRIQE